MSTEEILDTYGDRIYRLCFVILGNEADAEDALQETLIRYFQKKPVFSDSEHEKAWLLHVAANQCRDFLRVRKRHGYTDMDSLSLAAPEAPDKTVLEALMLLPEKYRLVMVLHYVEEYRVEDIAKMIGRTPSAVKMRLQKGRRLLGELYRREYL